MDKEQILQLKQILKEDISQIKNLEDLNILEQKYLGRKKGILTSLLKSLKDLSLSEKKEFGPLLQELKKDFQKIFAYKRIEIAEKIEDNEFFDITLPGIKAREGHLHLVTQAIKEIEYIFRHLGFVRRQYPEVEWDYYAFEALNMPIDHPARDEWETFFITKPEDINKKRIVLTPHTSSGQVREMQRGELPIRMINISKCYRRQSDISHTPMFHQFEGLLIDKDVNITHLKGVLNHFFKKFFGEKTKFRFRPYNFRFTEPSFEVDISCVLCGGKSCRYCKEGWSELGGAGMVHPNVLKAGGIDPDENSGFAFGWGVERVILMRDGLNISDLRILYKNDLRFLEQF